MDVLTIALIIIAVLALGGWGYGNYVYRPAAPAAPGAVVEGPAPWVNPLGVVGLLVVIALVVMLATGWRPFVVGPVVAP